MEHKQGINAGFTKRYACNKLVYFEKHQWIQDAIDREKQLKAGSRQNKVNLINQDNPVWNDLSNDWYGLCLRILLLLRISQWQNGDGCFVRLNGISYTLYPPQLLKKLI